MAVTRLQRESLYRLYTRNNDGSNSYLSFRRRATLCGVTNDMYLGIQWCGMFVGIETDGYSHT
jgi:hypothetical protein